MVTLDVSARRGSNARRINVSFAPRIETALSLPAAFSSQAQAGTVHVEGVGGAGGAGCPGRGQSGVASMVDRLPSFCSIGSLKLGGPAARAGKCMTPESGHYAILVEPGGGLNGPLGLRRPFPVRRHSVSPPVRRGLTSSVR